MEREELEKKLAEATQAALEANNTVQRLRSQLRAMPVSHEAEFERLRAMGFPTYSDGARKGDVTIDLVEKANGSYAWEADFRLPCEYVSDYCYPVPTGVGETPEEALGALRNSLMEMSAYIAEAAAKVPGGCLLTPSRLPWFDPQPRDVFSVQVSNGRFDPPETHIFVVLGVGDGSVQYVEVYPDNGDINDATVDTLLLADFTRWEGSYSDLRVIFLGGAS